MSIDHALAGFATAFGREADGVWSAPGRVNLIGEHTDYNEGFVLPFAIDHRTWVAVGVRTDRVVRVASAFTPEVAESTIDDVGPEKATGWAAYPFGTVWGLGEVLNGRDGSLAGSLADARGFDAYFVSDVPIGAGLSSSAALECSLAVALNDEWELGLSGMDLVRATQLAENEVVGAPTGILDQSASLLTEADAALFLDCRSGESRSVSLGLADAALTILVIDTRVTHAHADGGYASRRAGCERAAKAMGVRALRDVAVADLEGARERMDEEAYLRMRHIVTENQRVLDTVAALESVGAAGIGELMVASHDSQRDDFEVSVPELDVAVTTAVAAGALGARLTGGGFGGSAIALVPDHLVDDVTTSVRKVFAEQGFTEPKIFAVAPSAGAHRDR